MGKNLTLSIIIPVFNSENTIRQLIEKLLIILENKYTFEIIVINDNSIDKSYIICKELAYNDPRIKLISLSKNFGQHHALMAGFKFASGDYILCMDDDLQTQPEEIEKLISKICDKNLDVVYAKYSDKKHSFFRNLGSRINDSMSYHLLNKPKEIAITSFFVARRYIINEILKYENPYPYIGGLILRVTQNIDNVVVEHRERGSGKSNYNFKRLMSLWLNGFTSFSVKPLRISSIFGFILSFVSFIFIFLMIIEKIFMPQIQLGWTSLMVTITFFGGIQLLSIGIVGEYVGRIFICLNKTPQYVIKETINFDGISKTEIR